MKNTHLAFSALAFLGFLATGLYMEKGFPELYAGNEVAHMMFRANHIYLLLSAAVHGALGFYIQKAHHRAANAIQIFASLALLLSTSLFLAAFFLETAAGDFERPLTLFAVVSTVVAMGLFAISALLEAKSRVVFD